MSQVQVQVQNPSAALSGSQILNKNQSLLSQPLMSIPSTTSSLPSENAGRPIQNSALPSASITSTSAAAVPSNMAHPKEKTPVCLVTELARFNKIQPECKLLREQGPAHCKKAAEWQQRRRGQSWRKVFTVQLTLGDQHWEAEGTSIKKAQHTAAAKALEGTKFPKPIVRPFRSEGRNPGIMRGPRQVPFKSVSRESITPTVELNALCMKLGKKPMYKPVDPYSRMQSTYNYNMRGGAYPPRYFYPFPVPPLLYQVELSVGGQQFNGKGKTRQAAKHDAAAKALRTLQNEPPPDRLEVNGRESEEENLNKSEISQVFEIALKRNLPVNFESFPLKQVARESGPPHMKSFVTRVSVGEFVGEGEGKSKKISKKNAAIAVLEELKKLPPLPTVERVKPRIKKKTKSIVRVKVGNHTAEGSGTNKKVAKRNAAENMLEILGFKVPQAQPTKPALKSEEKTPIKKPGDGRKVTFFEPGSGDENGTSNKEDEFRMPYLSHQQLPAGILPMVPEVAQAVGVSQGHHTREFTRVAPNPAKATVTAMIARELLYGGTSPTAEAILKNDISSGHVPHGPLTRPSEQLDYLSRVQGFQVEYKDFPRNNKNEFVSLINCSSQPPLISHGIGKDVESCHDMAALNILKLLSELDQQNTEMPRTGNGPMSVCGRC
ncbi:double-stranded RNA-binding protein Staufen homolog 1 isoform X7 [Balaenoptera acutorostrata]|uniref:Double-stranded RNA-binding protein Staufen homolog 1 isoform X7 n=1 Tax=Balaenoptera acutorostrata TaxID=9767 RepID=A0ABM3S7A3_BALAC|nr:double-stranded RNA-binding protein Staufen homolog 1 isoform X7 [Balaenoptera acutorostrata]